MDLLRRLPQVVKALMDTVMDLTHLHPHLPVPKAPMVTATAPVRMVEAASAGLADVAVVPEADLDVMDLGIARRPMVLPLEDMDHVPARVPSTWGPFSTTSESVSAST